MTTIVVIHCVIYGWIEVKINNFPFCRGPQGNPLDNTMIITTLANGSCIGKCLDFLGNIRTYVALM